jgi:large subunit ribosomal protein L29
MKLSELREKSIDELQETIISWKKDLLNYKIQLATHKLENTALIPKTKRSIAQAKTVINEKSSGKEVKVSVKAETEAPVKTVKTSTKKTTKAKVQNA